MNLKEQLFLRQAQVIVGKSGDADALKISGLRITFKIDKTVLSDPNKATIQIYNLNKKSRTKFEEKLARVILKVGYGEDEKDLTQLFIGDIRRVAHVKQGPDWITEVEAGDGEIDFTGAQTNKSYVAGTPLKDVFNGVVSEFKDVKNNFTNALKFTGTLAQTFMATGSVSNVLDKITSRIDKEWSIQDGELQVLDVGQPTFDSAVLISPETGLVGSPAKTLIGFQVVSLLNTQLKPARPVSIFSRDAQGLFRVQSVQHQGDTFQGQWLTICELEVPQV